MRSSSVALIAHVIQVLIGDDVALGPVVILHHHHIRLRMTIKPTLVLRHAIAPQHRPLPPTRAQTPLLAIELQPVRAREEVIAPLVVFAGDVAHPVFGLMVLGLVPFAPEGLAPRTAHLALPVEAAVFRDAVADPRCEAGDQGVLVRAAEMADDEGFVRMGVVVFELQVVGFAGDLRNGVTGGAEAEGADQEVAIVVVAALLVIAAGEAVDFADFDFSGCEGEVWSE